VTRYVDARNLPAHVAIIMDGNGRWAERRGLPRTEGHRAGSDAVRRIVRAARWLGIKALTLFAFSEQNWGRPDVEVSTLMTLLRDFLVSERDEILSNGIRLRAIGDLDRLPLMVRAVLEPLACMSARNDDMVLSLALSYGGREEIAAAARRLAQRVARGEIDPDEIDAEMLGEAVPSVSVGDPDLIVRTGGELRISNFLLWGAAYSELHFSSALWPDFAPEHLWEAVAAYQARERRFGLTGPQARTATSSAAGRVPAAKDESQVTPERRSDLMPAHGGARVAVAVGSTR
jgi:undecaprenyl diphosphate synthase